MKNAFRFTIAPQWEKIEDASEALIRFLEEQNLGDDAIATINMVLCELIENALKYGRFEDESVQVEMTVEIDEKSATIAVKNPVHEDSLSHLKRLDQTVQWIRGHQDPFEAYVQRLKEISKRPLTDEESGLGLARIAYEGQSLIDFIVDDNDILTVSAVASIRDLEGSSQ